MAGLIIQKTLAGRIFDFGSRISILKKCGLIVVLQKPALLLGSTISDTQTNGASVSADIEHGAVSASCATCAVSDSSNWQNACSAGAERAAAVLPLET